MPEPRLVSVQHVGDKLRQERESRNRSIDDIADSSKIERSYLEALERGELDALPGRAIGKFYIRVYAEVLDFDPGPLIADYDREQMKREQARRPRTETKAPAARRRWRPTAPAETPVDPEPEPQDEVPPEPVAAEPVPDTAAVEPTAEPQPEPVAVASSPVEPLPVEPPPVPAERRSRRWILWAAVVATALILLVAVGVSRSGRAGRVVASPPVAPPAPKTAEPAPAAAVRAETVAPPAEREPPAPAVVPSPPVPASDLTVSEFGVGRKILDRRLEGRGDRFEAGSVVYFSTRVLGGRRGETVRHVWKHEGVPVQRVDLELGGAHWRTHSRKTLWAEGRWTVEALDADGRVLATDGFDCVPKQ